MSKKLYFIRVGAGKFVAEYNGTRVSLENDSLMSAFDQAECLSVMLGADMVCADEWTEETKP